MSKLMHALKDDVYPLHRDTLVNEMNITEEDWISGILNYAMKLSTKAEERYEYIYMYYSCYYVLKDDPSLLLSSYCKYLYVCFIAFLHQLYYIDWPRYLII